MCVAVYVDPIIICFCAVNMGEGIERYTGCQIDYFFAYIGLRVSVTVVVWIFSFTTTGMVVGTQVVVGA